MKAGKLLKVSANRALSMTLMLVTGSLLLSCDNYFKNDYADNSPTSGKLKVYYDEGLQKHLENQVLTFSSQYYNAEVKLYQSADNEAVQALYNDTCELIIISRNLSDTEKKAFASKNFDPKFTLIAKSGIAVITNNKTSINHLSLLQLQKLLTTGSTNDSLGSEITPKVLFDKNNSSVLHFMRDSILHQQKLADNCNILGSTLECLNYISKNNNTIGIIDFAWLSDSDDSLYKSFMREIKFVAISTKTGSVPELPNQSSFKLGTYPLTRSIYAIRKTGEFSLAKGFQSYLAGPKGQLTFLKQGLLPARQSERNVKINMEKQDSKP